MRFAAFTLMACLAGCSLSSGGIGGECVSDSQCGDDVCARSGECLASSSLRRVLVKWTVNGQPAADATCNAHPDLFLQFDGPDFGDSMRFAPVPCRTGSFFIDKLPKRYQQLELGVEGRTGDVTAIEYGSSDRSDRIGQAQFDLIDLAQ